MEAGLHAVAVAREELGCSGSPRALDGPGGPEAGFVGFAGCGDEVGRG